jgi:Carbohydrate-selective porin, OprB family
LIKHRIAAIGAAMFIAVVLSSAQAYEVTEHVWIGGVIAGAYQYQFLTDDEDGTDEGGGAVPLQPEVGFRLTDTDTIFIKFGFAADDGLNAKSPFSVSPWAADLEADVKNINGRDRDYLLTAWYQHVFKFKSDYTLSVTAGLIDATDYLDENAFANDEYIQFMNAALTNGPNVFLPSYDMGGALELTMSRLAIRAVVMNVGENDDGNNYTFWGVQLSYILETPLGEGTYRIVLDGTTDDFLDVAGTEKESLGAVILSFDQPLGGIVGAFARMGWQKDDAAIDLQALYSGGLNISGKLWQRPQDNVGLGYAYIDGGNLDIERIHVVEAYARFVLNDYVAVTTDLQYIDEQYTDGSGPAGWMPGLRITAEF